MLDSTAKESGFIVRERIVTGSNFVENLLFTKFNHSKLSLNQLAESLTRQTGLKISKQAVNEHFNQKSVEFMKRVLEKALKKIWLSNPYPDFIDAFPEVRIKDSTSFQLPEEFAKRYPGSGGKASKASIRIQFEYDFKSGKILDLSLHAFNDQDIKDSIDTVDQIQPGVLILRDLGYISLDVLTEIKRKKAFFISRLINQVSVYQATENGFKKVEIKKLHNTMKKNKCTRLEMELYIGRKKEKVRLILELLPQKIVEKRIRTAQKNAKSKGYKVSEEYKTRSKLNIFITNIPSEILDSQQIHEVYTLRWQIELVFKVWKSIGEIAEVKKMKHERFETFLYAKLLWLIINWSIIWQINAYVYKTQKKIISLFKAYNSLKDNVLEFKITLKKGVETLTEFLEKQIYISSQFHILEKKRNSNTLYKLVEIM